MNNTALEVEVTVDETHINSIRFTNLNDSITTMYPFIEPAIEDIAEQVYKKQSLENIQYSSDTPYTSQLIVQAIENALKKPKLQSSRGFFFALFCSCSDLNPQR